MMPLMARIFVTRELPFDALDRLRDAHDVDVWEGMNRLRALVEAGVQDEFPAESARVT